MVNQIKKPFLEVLIFTSMQLAVYTAMGYSESVLLPSQVIEMVGNENKEITIGILTAISTLFMSLSALISGTICDLFSIQYPIIIIGCILFSISLISRTFLVQQWWMIFPHAIFYIIGKIGIGASGGAINSLIPILFHKTQLGAVGGFNSFFILLGELFGMSIIGYAYNFISPIIWSGFCSVAVLISLVLLFFSILIDKIAIYYYSKKNISSTIYDEDSSSNKNDISIGEDLIDDIIGKIEENQDFDDSKALLETNFKKNLVPNKIISLLTSFKNYVYQYRLFNFLIVSNFFMIFSLTLGLNYFLYFLEDVIATDGDYHIIIPWLNKYIKNAFQARALLGFISLAFSLVASLAFGILSDLVKGRLIIAIGANITFTICKAVNILTLNFNFILLTGIFSGIATGVFSGVIFALVNEMIPNPKTAGRDLAISTFFATLSGILSSLIGGLILYVSRLISNGNLLGFYVIFVIEFICNTISIICMFLIMVYQNTINKKSKKVIKSKNLALINDDIFDSM